MKVEKLEYKGNNNWFLYYYLDSKTNLRIEHGLFNSRWCIGYVYHDENKGFCLKEKNW